ncbi:MAG: FecR domain-containing protein [Spartobacteria bacterium]
MKIRSSNLLILTLSILCHVALAQNTENPTTQQAANSPATAQAPTMNLGNIRVVKVEGKEVQLVDASGQTSPLKEGSFIRQGAKIQTGKEASVVLLFDNGTTVNIKPETEFAVEKFAQDPFDANGVDYQTLKSEPSSSVTRLNVPEGTIVLDIAKLKKDSSFQIATPVGSAGIRGTSLGVTSSKSNQANPVTVAVTTGVVQLKTATGSRTVSGGQSFGIGSAGGFSPNPPGSTGLQTATSQSAAAMKTAVPVTPFQGAPPPAPAPAAPGSTLTAAQQQTLQAASEQGSEALAAAVEQLAKSDPRAAAEIAAAAADALPVAATNVAAVAATVAPTSAAAIAANVAQAAPSAAPQLASTVAAIVPAAAVQVAQSVATAAPQAAAAIATAVVAAVPTANAAAVQSATQAGAQQSTQPGGGAAPNQPVNTGDQGTTTQGQSLPGSTGSNAGGSGNNPSTVRPTPQPTPTPTPTPAPTPIPTPTPPSS